MKIQIQRNKNTRLDTATNKPCALQRPNEQVCSVDLLQAAWGLPKYTVIALPPTPV